MAGEWRPSNWGEEVTLEYGKAIRGYSPTHGKYRVFGSNGPIGWTSEALTQGPGVILGRKGAYRGVEYWRDPFWVIDTAYYLVPKTDLDMRWLYYAVKHYKLGEVDDGSPIPSTTRSAVYMLELDVPSKPEQRAIAHILGALDDKIELNRRRNQTLEAMARALFKDWFVDFGPVRARMEGRDPYLPADLWSLFPDRFDSEGKPVNWESAVLGSVVEITKGRSYKSSELANSDTALVTLKSFLRGGGYRPDGLKPFTGPFKENQTVNPGDIVLACTDVTQAAEVIGRPAMIRRSSQFKRLVASLDTIIVRPKNERLTKAALYFLFCSEAFTSHALAHTTGTTVLHLGKDAVPSFLFNLAPPRIITRFDAKAAPMLAEVQENELENETLAELRDTLLPKLISGALRVPDAERIVGAST